MRLLLATFVFLSLPLLGGEWSIHWEAAKGDSMCSIPYEPRSLDSIQSSLPAGHLEADADIKNGLKPAKFSTEILGVFKGRKVLTVELEVPTSYYSRYFLIVAEVEDRKFMPIYIHQFAPGSHAHGKPTFRSSESDFLVTVTSTTHGTSPSKETFRITCNLKTPPKTEQVSGGNGGQCR